MQRAINRFDDYSREFFNGERPDLFLLMFGINDALASDPDKFVFPENFYLHYSELCSMLKKSNPNVEIVLMTPPITTRVHVRKAALIITVSVIG